MSISSRRHGLRGFTMIELVASLSVFVIIVSILYALTENALDIWSVEKDGQKERARADAAFRILEQDLREAVTDNGVTSNQLSGTAQASFILNGTSITNTTATTWHLLLRFAKPKSERISSSFRNRAALDAVAYSYYNHSLYRHIVPMEWKGEMKTLSQRIDETIQAAGLESISEQMEADPAKVVPGHTRLLRHVRVVNLYGAIRFSDLVERSDALVLGEKDKGLSEQNNLYSLESYSEILSQTLPSSVSMELQLISEDEWEEWKRLVVQEPARAEALGTYASKKIVLPAAGGSRLP